MSDTTGSSGFTRGVTTAERIANAGLNNRRTGGRLVGGGAQLGAEERGGNIRISGEVVEERSDRDGRTTQVKIRTVRGDVEIERDGDRPLPRKGQRVELEIRQDAPRHGGNDGQTVIIRTENTARIATNTASHTKPNDQSQNTRITATPIDVQIQSQTINPSSPPTVNTQVVQNIDSVNIAAQPLSDMQALMNVDTLVRLTAMDAQTVTQNVPSPILQSANLSIIDASTINVSAPPRGVGIYIKTAITFSDDSAQLARAALITNTPAALPAPVSPLAARENASPPSQISAGDVLSLALNTPPSQGIDTALLDIDTRRVSAPLSRVLNVRIESLSPPLAALQPDGAQNETIPPVLPENTGAAAVLSDARAGEIHAVITGQTADKLPTMSIFYAQTEGGMIYTLQAPVDTLAVGTRLTLTPVIEGAPNTQTALNVNTPVPLSVFIQPSAQWASLNQTAAALSVTAAQVAQNLAAVTPNPANPAQLTPALMLFVAAVRGGDFSTWLGNKAMDAIRASGRGDILSRIGQESGLLARMNGAPVSGDWSGINIPLHFDGQYQKAAFYHHDFNEDGDDGKRGGRRQYTRFIFDLSLSNMGGVQVDGLLRRERLDIVLRTKAQLSQTMQRDMRRVYANALNQADFTGDLSFQNDARHWITIKPDDRHFGVSA